MPIHNAMEAAVVEGVDVYGVCSLSEVVQFLRGEKVLEPVRSTNGWPKQRIRNRSSISPKSKVSTM
ncbi:MAG: hypothetical protein JO170_29725 [Verrucomicrobia bacterium]|nr:hypothetical protein [Verrucomicrobiota bacterium]